MERVMMYRAMAAADGRIKEQDTAALGLTFSQRRKEG